jgi:hypothetical protein
MVFENRVLKKILLGPNRDEVREKWRPHKNELYELYSSQNIIRG